MSDATKPAESVPTPPTDMAAVIDPRSINVTLSVHPGAIGIGPITVWPDVRAAPQNQALISQLVQSVLWLQNIAVQLAQRVALLEVYTAEASRLPTDNPPHDPARFGLALSQIVELSREIVLQSAASPASALDAIKLD